MKKEIIVFSIILVVSISAFLITDSSLTGFSVYEDSEKIKLGFCPTMQEEAENLAKQNNYELVKLKSASEVLYMLKSDKIDKALIGRKAKAEEINPETKELILKSGYTLVSNQKKFVDYSQLSALDIYSHLENNFAFPTKIISKKEIESRVQESKIVLISWDDWNDYFELIVVMDGSKKVKEFRGSFLYEN